jgi:hypothetical protein
MLRNEFLDRVSEQLGFEIPRHVLEYAHQIAAVDEPTRLPYARRVYSQHHEKQFVEYMRNRIKKSRMNATKDGV